MEHVDKRPPTRRAVSRHNGFDHSEHAEQQRRAQAVKEVRDSHRREARENRPDMPAAYTASDDPGFTRTEASSSRRDETKDRPASDPARRPAKKKP